MYKFAYVLKMNAVFECWRTNSQQFREMWNQIDKQKKKPDIKVKSFTKYLKNKKNEQKIEEILLNIDQ